MADYMLDPQATLPTLDVREFSGSDALALIAHYFKDAQCPAQS